MGLGRHCGAVTIASCVFPVGGYCCAKVFSELRGALIGVVVEVVGGPDWVAAGLVLTAQTESIDSEVIGVGSVLTAEVEVEQGGREVRLRVDVDGARALEVALGMAVDMFAQLPCLLGRQFTHGLLAFTQTQPIHKPLQHPVGLRILLETRAKHVVQFCAVSGSCYISARSTRVYTIMRSCQNRTIANHALRMR